MLPGLFLKRLKIIFIFVVSCFIAIFFKLSYNTLFIYQSLTLKASALHNRQFPLVAPRGIIYDCSYQPLVTNQSCTSLYAIPNLVEDKEKTAAILKDYLAMSEADILQRLKKNASLVSFHPNGKKLSLEVSNAIKKLNLPGIYLIQDTLRTYPYNQVLANLLGFVGIDNEGLAGLESYYDDYLQGEDGYLEYQTNGKGGILSNKYFTYTSPSVGTSMLLTIDINLQNILEREMENAYLLYEPEEIMGIMLNPNNGQILAIGNRPTYDNNAYQDYDPTIYNRLLPIFNTFEPGSTFKAITFASALNENLFDMNEDTYYDIGYEMVNGVKISSWKKGGHGLQTYLEVLQNSSNPGFVAISRKLGKERLYQYIKDFGFLEKTSVDIQGENLGLFFDKEDFNELEQATTSFGQGISINALQLVVAYASIINGGYLYRPYVVKGFLNHLNEMIEERTPTLVRQVISAETSKKMQYALESVVAKGSGKKAYIDGYRIGGKTGTSQIQENGAYLENQYLLSFIASAPMNDPQIVCYFAMKKPQNCVQYGGTTIGPIMKNIMQDALSYLNVPLDYQNQIPKAYTWMDEKTYVVPSYIGYEKKQVKSSYFNFKFIGEGNIVTSQTPLPGTMLEANSTIMLLLNE